MAKQKTQKVQVVVTVFDGVVDYVNVFAKEEAAKKYIKEQNMEGDFDSDVSPRTFENDDGDRILWYEEEIK
jgi:hypothetical protein